MTPPCVGAVVLTVRESYRPETPCITLVELARAIFNEKPAPKLVKMLRPACGRACYRLRQDDKAGLPAITVTQECVDERAWEHLDFDWEHAVRCYIPWGSRPTAGIYVAAKGLDDVLWRALWIRKFTFGYACTELLLKDRRRMLRDFGSNSELRPQIERLERSIADGEDNLEISRKRIDWFKEYPNLSAEEREHMP